MSIDISNINYPVKDHLKTKIVIQDNHFLIKLAESIPWESFAELAINDLYNDRKKSGKKLNIRLHLGACILQSLFNWTDRELEENLNYYAPAKVFCGITDRAYTHSAYVKFRNRLNEDTIKRFNVNLLKVASRKGFTGSEFMDFDSTVQEANIEYPTDIRMMQSLLRKANKTICYLVEKGSRKAKKIKESYNLDRTFKDIKTYFFAKKCKKGFELKKKIFKSVERKTNKMVKEIQGLSKVIQGYKLKWNIKKDVEQITTIGPKLLKQIRYFIKHQKVADNKILSLHAKEVKCIVKGKIGKPCEFGRKYFIGRLPGNYSFVFTDKNIGLEDSVSLECGINEFKEIFDVAPSSITGDQGFWSRPNLKSCHNHNIKEIGITPRGYKNWKVPTAKIDEMKKRRSKVEPIIGHLKRRGMGRSKMKSDEMTKLAGQRSSFSLNMVRLIKDLQNEELKSTG